MSERTESKVQVGDLVRWSAGDSEHVSRVTGLGRSQHFQVDNYPLTIPPAWLIEVITEAPGQYMEGDPAENAAMLLSLRANPRGAR